LTVQLCVSEMQMILVFRSFGVAIVIELDAVDRSVCPRKKAQMSNCLLSKKRMAG
jgi:hypothetical protein